MFVDKRRIIIGKKEKGKITTNYKQRVRNSNKSLKTTIVNWSNKLLGPFGELGSSQRVVCRSNVPKTELPIYQKLQQAKGHSIVREIALKKVGSEPPKRSFTKLSNKGGTRRWKLNGHQNGNYNQIWGSSKAKIRYMVWKSSEKVEGKSTIWRVDQKEAVRVTHQPGWLMWTYGGAGSVDKCYRS